MKTIALGNTGLTVTKTSIGCLPVQRCGLREGAELLRAAYEGGITLFDTANAYTDSEKKLGIALEGVRGEVVICTKSAATDRDTLLRHVDNSLSMLNTDYIDLLQFHNAHALPDPDAENGIYQTALMLKRDGRIRHIGITSHSLPVAEASVESGLYETLQYPFSYLSTPRELLLAKKCADAGMGYIAMKGLAGGLLGKHARACHAFIGQYENVVAIWGMQTVEELRTWLQLAKEDPALDETLQAQIDADRAQLAGAFCRSCGYCLPCAAGIDIPNCARMDMLLRRSPWQQYYTPQWRAKMEKIRDCSHCNACKSRCPYGLDTPAQLTAMLADYEAFYEARRAEGKI